MTRPLLATIALLLAAPGGSAQFPNFPDAGPQFRRDDPFGPGGWANQPAPGGWAQSPAPVATPTPLGTPPGFFTAGFRLVMVPCAVLLMVLIAALTALSRGPRRRRGIPRRRRRVDYEDDDRPRRGSVRPRLAPPAPPALAARVVEAQPLLAKPPVAPPDLPFV